jgi:hypothetical protein
VWIILGAVAVVYSKRLITILSKAYADNLPSAGDLCCSATNRLATLVFVLRCLGGFDLVGHRLRWASSMPIELTLVSGSTTRSRWESETTVAA